MFVPLLLAAAASAAPPCDVYWSVQGRFSAQAEWLVNRINAPSEQQLRRPPDLEVAPGVLEALSSAIPKAIEEAVRARSRRACPDPWKGPPEVPRRKPGQKPVQFALHVNLGGSDGLGGQYAGTSVRLDLWSLGLPADQVGRASRRLLALDSPEAAVRELNTRLSEALVEAEAALDAALYAAEHPARVIPLTLEFYGSNGEAARALAALVACWARVAGAAGFIETHPPEKNTRRFELRFPAAARGPLAEGLAEAIRTHTTPHGKSRCSQFGTPLAGLRVEASVREGPGGRGIRVRMRNGVVETTPDVQSPAP